MIRATAAAAGIQGVHGDDVGCVGVTSDLYDWSSQVIGS
jgi:hypothetical protein